MNIFKKLAMKHFNLVEKQEKLSQEECNRRQFGELVFLADSQPTIQTCIDELQCASKSDNLEGFKIEMRRNLNSIRHVPLQLSSIMKTSTDDVTFIIRYTTKFD